MRILIVEDDSVLGDGLSRALKLECYAVDLVENKSTAELALRTHDYGMILMDIGLPDGSGLDLLTKIRLEKNRVPILVLTAYDKLHYKIEGLDAGADDYLIKPFKLDELKARIRALHRRREGRVQGLLKIGDLELNLSSKKVTVAGESLDLEPKEFAILTMLMERPESILSKEIIENSLYGWNMEIVSNTIQVYVSRLRKKLGKKSIETIKNVGYRFGKLS